MPGVPPEFEKVNWPKHYKVVPDVTALLFKIKPGPDGPLVVAGTIAICVFEHVTEVTADAIEGYAISCTLVKAKATAAVDWVSLYSLFTISPFPTGTNIDWISLLPTLSPELCEL